MTQTILPPPAAIKTHAKRLRTALAAQGTQVSHAKALEAVAQQWGFRDWNTLNAASTTAPRWHVGQEVTGRYLGHVFTGRLKAVAQKPMDHAQITVVFDKAVDVVASDKFSALRRQVTAIIGASGQTVEKTSDGQPHLVLS